MAIKKITVINFGMGHSLHPPNTSQKELVNFYSHHYESAKHRKSDLVLFFSSPSGVLEKRHLDSLIQLKWFWLSSNSMVKIQLSSSRLTPLLTFCLSHCLPPAHLLSTELRERRVMKRHCVLVNARCVFHGSFFFSTLPSYSFSQFSLGASPWAEKQEIFDPLFIFLLKFMQLLEVTRTHGWLLLFTIDSHSELFDLM